jgi:hypothetical protein
MYANSAFITEFDRITAPVRISGLDLIDAVHRLDVAAAHAVRSLLGWSLTVRVDGANVTLTSIQPWTSAADVRASFRVPLSAFLTAGRDGSMVFYAAAPHAFSRLTEEFLPAVSTGKRRIGIDQDLNPELVSGLSGVRQMSTIDRAISFLLTGGETLEVARLQLQALARSTQTTVHQAAQAMLSRPPAASYAGSIPAQFQRMV